MDEARRDAQDLCLRRMNTGLIRRRHQICPPVVVLRSHMSRRPFPPDDGLATPITALRAECRVEDLCTNCDRVARLDLGALIASRRGSAPLIRLKLRCRRCGIDRSRLIVSGVSASERFDEDHM
jgi:hypothetical protein